MSVSNVTSAAGVGQSNWRSTVQQAGQDFEQLFQAMQAGNLSAAQQAYAAFQQLQSGSASATASSGTAATDAGTSAVSAATTTAAANPVASDWSALGQALQSGSLTSAQTAFSQLQQDLQSSAQGAGGHHHHDHAVENAQAVYSAMQAGNAASATGTGTGSATGTGSVSSDLSALQQALQSGDTSSAQSLLAQLENDLQASGQTSGVGGRHHHYGGFAAQNSAAAYAVAPISTATGSAGSSATA